MRNNEAMEVIRSVNTNRNTSMHVDLSFLLPGVVKDAIYGNFQNNV